MTKLHMAVDPLSMAEALKLAERVQDVVDILEVGTPMIVRDGLHPVTAIRKSCPSLTVLADTKIVDGGQLECSDACKAGADIITVLAAAADDTVSAVAETARRYGRKTMADLICVSDVATRARQVLALGVDYVCVHTAVDVQASGISPLSDFQRVLETVPPERVAIAGGIRLSTLDGYLIHKPAIVVMGGALYNAPDVRKAIGEVQERIQSYAGR